MLRDKSFWIGVVVVGLAAAYIEIGRRLDINVPIPFLLLFSVVVVVAALGGVKAGMAGGFVASLFIVYAMLIEYGPPSLTGGPVQAAMGIALMVLVGCGLGRMRDQNQHLIGALEKSRAELEHRVEERTAELSTANKRLNQENKERIGAEEALRAKEVYYRLLIENAMDIVTVLDSDGTIRYESPSVRRVLGYAPEEMVGRNVFEFIHPDDVSNVQDVFNRGRKLPAGQSSITELRFRHKDGSWRVLEAVGNNLLSDPDVAGAIINSRDITQRREMEKRVQRQEQLAMVGQLAAGIAHDFNNAMAVIVLYAQLLGMSPNLTAKEKKRLDTILEEGKRAAELTAQILDFGRQTLLDKQPLDLLPFLQDFVKLLRRTLADNIEVAFEHGEGNFVVTADSKRIQQALMNLAFNSRDAMPDGGRILVSLSQLPYEPEERPTIISELADGEWVQIVVADNGSGISAAAQDHLFEPFFTTKEPGRGTGLGLAQVYGIVKQHNGFVGVDSEIGMGTTITITLPAAGEGRLDGVAPDFDKIPKGNGELIVVVEDNYSTRIALMAALESLNYKVKGAKNGVEALVLLGRHREEAALVVSDVVMPEMGGIALLDAMEAGGIDIPAFLLTGNSAVEELALAQSQERVEWHSKPIPLERLGQVVAEKIH